jgi:hypothetical protein
MFKLTTNEENKNLTQSYTEVHRVAQRAYLCGSLCFSVVLCVSS